MPGTHPDTTYRSALYISPSYYYFLQVGRLLFVGDSSNGFESRGSWYFLFEPQINLWWCIDESSNTINVCSPNENNSMKTYCPVVMTTRSLPPSATSCRRYYPLITTHLINNSWIPRKLPMVICILQTGYSLKDNSQHEWYLVDP